MTQAEYEDYYPNAVQNLANETAKANRVSPDETLCSARRCFETLLPEGNLKNKYRIKRLCRLMCGKAVPFRQAAIEVSRLRRPFEAEPSGI